MKCKYTVLIVCLSLVFTLFGCSQNKTINGKLTGDEVYKITPYTVAVLQSESSGANSITVNNPQFAYWDGIIYYTSKAGQDSMCNVMQISREAESLDKAQIWLENQIVDSQYLNYMFTVKGGKLLCYDLSQSNKIQLQIDLPSNYVVFENVLYYIIDGNAFAVDMQSGNQLPVSGGKYTAFKAENNRLWLLAADNTLYQVTENKISEPVAKGITLPFTVIEDTIFYTQTADNQNTIYRKDFGNDEPEVILENIPVFYDIMNIDGYVYAAYALKDEQSAVLACYDFEQSKSDLNTTFKTVIYNTSGNLLTGCKQADQPSVICYGPGILSAGSNNVLEPGGIYLKTNVYENLVIFMRGAKGQHFYFEIYELGPQSRQIAA